jgi:glycosyltransferase involved in cell wall biosynthesis
LLGITGAVTFTGYVPDPDALYAASDVVLMCSRNEAMGRVTAEAMSYGKAVVAFRGGATPELITHGKNGLLYETMEAFVQSMNELVQSPERRASLGRQAADDACARFSDEAYADAVFQIYRECIKKQA